MRRFEPVVGSRLDRHSPFACSGTFVDRVTEEWGPDTPERRTVRVGTNDTRVRDVGDDVGDDVRRSPRAGAPPPTRARARRDECASRGARGARARGDDGDGGAFGAADRGRAPFGVSPQVSDTTAPRVLRRGPPTAPRHPARTTRTPFPKNPQTHPTRRRRQPQHRRPRARLASVHARRRRAQG